MRYSRKKMSSTKYLKTLKLCWWRWTMRQIIKNQTLVGFAKKDFSETTRIEKYGSIVTWPEDIEERRARTVIYDWAWNPRKLLYRWFFGVSSVKTKKLYPVAIHFNNTNHSINDVEIIVIEACTSNDTGTHRKLRESHWIHQLKTLQPYGLNINTGIK